MLNNGIYKFLLIAVILLSACSIHTIPFSSENLNENFFKNITKFWNNKLLTGWNKISIYQASMLEELVDRDGIPEFKLINQASSQSRSADVATQNSQKLYLCIINTNKESERLCMFLASTYNTKEKCTKLGPAYLGVIRMEQINIKKQLVIKNTKTASYYIADTVTSNLDFIAENALPAKNCSLQTNADSACTIRITEIINKNINKIGGKKNSIYNIKKIFGDNDALVFKYVCDINNTDLKK
ncbi:MAG: hypothetical protein ABJA78_12980 [Ferruginibacter sp.]